MINSLGFCHALVKQTGQAFFAYDIDSNQFTYLSPAFEALFSIQSSRLNSSTFLSLVKPEDQGYVQEKHAELLQKGSIKAVEFRIQFPDQAEQWVCLTTSLLEEEPGKRFIIGHADDVTAQRQYNDNLKKFSNKKNSILNILSHDLASPLANIQGLSALLAQDLKSGESGDAQVYINLIEKSSKQAAQLIHDFINEELLESSQVELITRRVNLVEKLQEVLAEYQGPKGELIGMRVEFCASSEEIYAVIDDNKFMQVINNLISNALKFTPDNGEVTVCLEEEAESVLFKVVDTGIGIQQKHHAVLFDKFTDARRPGLKGEVTHGLGMSIIKTIVEWHRGMIWFESKEGKGRTFYIRIPKY